MMTHCNQPSPPEGCASPVIAYPAAGLNVSGPPPMGYPTKDGPIMCPQQDFPKTVSRGDGFWKGCLAAICCCCVLDCCF